jgi:hypothetical protein
MSILTANRSQRFLSPEDFRRGAAERGRNASDDAYYESARRVLCLLAMAGRCAC